ncbi:voltage-gated chloride channel family protein [soil metagenome]
MLAVLRLARLAALAVVSGALAGLAGWFFLTALDAATDARLDHPGLVWLLPVAGLALGGAYHLFDGRAGEGNALLLDEIHQPTAWVPRRLAPMVAVGTVWSHLFGASVGREGTALQMSGSLTDLLARTLHLDPDDRRTLLVAAIGAGFGAVFGAPLAATVFALEVQLVRRPGSVTALRDRVSGSGPALWWAGSVGALRWSRRFRRSPLKPPVDPEPPTPRWRSLVTAAVPTAVAAYVGNAVVRTIGHHGEIQPRFLEAVDATLLGRVALLGVLLGLIAVAFVEATDVARWAARRWIRWAPARPAAAGLVVLVVVALVGRDQLGLSVALASDALAGHPVGFEDPALKLALTALCLGFGFVGGEVTPLLVIGATFGAAAGSAIGLDPVTGATVGFVALFAGAANVPLAGTALGVELFGLGAALPVAVACATAHLCSGNRGIYGAQRVTASGGPVRVDTLPSVAARARRWARPR